MQAATVAGKAAEDDAPERGRRRQRGDCRCDRYIGGTIGGESIDAGGNRGKCDRSQAVGLAEVDGADVARRQRVILAGVAAAPDRADSMNHMPRRQPISQCDFGAAGLAAMEGAAFGKKLGPRRAVDRAIDAAPAEQGRIGGVDDGVNA